MTTLTRRIQKLEAYLAVRLFDRTTRSVWLTAIGRDFMPQARRLVDELTFAVGHLQDKSRLGLGHVTIASIPTMAHHTLPEVIRASTQQHPGNRIRIIESNAADVYRAVLTALALVAAGVGRPSCRVPPSRRARIRTSSASRWSSR